MTETSPYRPADESAKQMARDLIAGAQFGALAVIAPNSLPSVSRIALATDQRGGPITLISSLSDHTKALRANPGCALLVGEPTDRGEPLTHPRLTLHAIANFVERGPEQHDALRGRFLKQRPKAKLYIDFADFNFVTFTIKDGSLNAGFGKARRLSASDILKDQRTT